MDKLDDIWSVDLFGNFSYWLKEEDYIRIKLLMMDETVDKVQTAVTFTSVSGTEVVILLTNICNLQHSTKEARDTNRQNNKQLEEEAKKPEWEE